MVTKLRLHTLEPSEQRARATGACQVPARIFEKSVDIFLPRRHPSIFSPLLVSECHIKLCAEKGMICQAEIRRHIRILYAPRSGECPVQGAWMLGQDVCPNRNSGYRQRSTNISVRPSWIRDTLLGTSSCKCKPSQNVSTAILRSACLSALSGSSSHGSPARLGNKSTFQSPTHRQVRVELCRTSAAKSAKVSCKRSP